MEITRHVTKISPHGDRLSATRYDGCAATSASRAHSPTTPSQRSPRGSILGSGWLPRHACVRVCLRGAGRLRWRGGCACARVGCAGACAIMGDGPPPPAPQHTSSSHRLALMLSNGSQCTTRRARIGVGRAHAIPPPTPRPPLTHTHHQSIPRMCTLVLGARSTFRTWRRARACCASIGMALVPCHVLPGGRG